METFWFFRLRFRRAYDSAYDYDFWVSQGHKRSYDSDSDSVASESQPLRVKTAISFTKWHPWTSVSSSIFFFTSSCLSSVRPQKVVIRCPVLYAKALISAPAPLNTFGSWLQLKFVFVFTHLGAVGWEPHDGALESKWHIRIPTSGRPVLVRWWWTNVRV